MNVVRNHILTAFLLGAACCHTRENDPYIADLKSEDEERTLSALRALGEAERLSDPVVQSVLPLIRDNSEQVRVAAVSLLGWTLDARLIPPLAEALRDPAEEVRHSAWYALSQIGVSRGHATWKLLPPEFQFLSGRLEQWEGQEVERSHRIMAILSVRAGLSGSASGQQVVEAEIPAGQCAFAVPAPPAQGHISLWLEIRGAWRLLASGAYPQRGFFEPTRLRVPKERRRSIAIRVLDHATDEPVPNARLRLALGPDSGPLPHMAPVVTDRQGTAVFAPVPHGFFWLDVLAHGRAPVRVCPSQGYADDSDSETVWNVAHLEPGVDITGEVLSDRTELEGLWVTVSYRNARSSTTSRWHVDIDSNGNFTATVPANSEFSLEAGARGVESYSRTFKVRDLGALRRVAVRIGQ